MCVVGSRAGGVKPSSPFGAQMIVLQASDVRHRAVGFGVCPTGYWSCFGAVTPFYALSFLFGTGMLTRRHFMSEVHNLLIL